MGLFDSIIKSLYRALIEKDRYMLLVDGLKNTLIMCVAHLPCSVGILLIYAVCAAAMILIPPNPFTMILLPILYIWGSYKLFCKVFVHYWDMSDGHTAEPEEKEE